MMMRYLPKAQCLTVTTFTAVIQLFPSGENIGPQIWLFGENKKVTVIYVFSSSVHTTEAQKRPLAVNTHVICVLLSDSVSLGYYSMRQIVL